MGDGFRSGEKGGTVTYTDKAGTVWRAGDIGAASGNAGVSRLIQTGQRLRGDQYWKWNHIFVVVGDAGQTLEATGNGVAKGHVLRHDQTLNLGCPAGVDRAKVVEYAWSRYGVEYGYVDVVLLGFDCLTHARLRWRGDSLICSELGALALMAGGWASPLPAALTMPADLVAGLTLTKGLVAL